MAQAERRRHGYDSIQFLNSESAEKPSWVLEVILDCVDEDRTARPVYHAVVERAADVHLLADFDLILVIHDYLLADACHREDARVRLIYNRDEVVHVQHAHVGDGERAA